jgi:hypothetical protein
MLEFWETSPRVTVSGYRRQLAGAKRAQADERERQATELPDAATLVAMVRADGPAVLNRYAEIDDLLSVAECAEWLGLKAGTVYQERKRGRWPKADQTFGQSPAWTRRTLIIHRAKMPGVGHPVSGHRERKTA